MNAFEGDLGPGVHLRPISDADLPFLGALYASTREAELRQVPWSETQKAAFLASQFSCQHTYYQVHYPAARFDVIEREGRAIGRLYLASLDGVGCGELRIIDVALLPAERGRGIGTRLLRAIITRAESEGRSVSIHVERDNPALALYERLGFRLREDRGVYLFMVHPAGAAPEMRLDAPAPLQLAPATPHRPSAQDHQ
jgi:GNAT superfamily N-acetyltransferase